MRQVPATKNPLNPTYALLGSGQLARHLNFYLGQSGLKIKNWSRSGATEFNSMAEAEIKDPGQRLEATLEAVDVALLAISDRAINSLAQKLNSDRPTLPLVHFSGALSTPLAVGFHPLMTFGPQLYDLKTYCQMPFVGEKGRPSFQEFFPQLENPTYTIEPEAKALYHALCVMGGNFTHFLWQEVFSWSQKQLGLPPAAYFPYLYQSITNLVQNPTFAGTGPLVRGDRETVLRHLVALEHSPLKNVYSSFLDLKKFSL